MRSGTSFSKVRYLAIVLLSTISWGLNAQAPAPDPLDFKFTTKSRIVNHPPTNVDIHPFLMRAANGWFERSFAGVAVQVGRHEVGASYLLSNSLKFGGMLQYRYYLLRNQWRVQPFVGAYAMLDKTLLLINDQGFGGPGSNRSFGLSFGSEIALAPGVTAYFQQGLGLHQIVVPGQSRKWNFFDGLTMLGLRGSLRVKGDSPDRTWKKSSDFAQGQRLLLQYMVSGRPDMLYSNYMPAASGTMNVAAEYRATEFLRPYLGVTFGLAGPFWYRMTTREPMGFTFNGIETGLRIYSLTRPRWALFQDIGGSYANRPKYQYHNSRVWIGQGLSFRALNGVYLNGLMRLNMGERGGYADAAVGISVAPFAWKR